MFYAKLCSSVRLESLLYVLKNLNLLSEQWHKRNEQNKTHTNSNNNELKKKKRNRTLKTNSKNTHTHLYTSDKIKLEELQGAFKHILAFFTFNIIE